VGKKDSWTSTRFSYNRGKVGREPYHLLLTEEGREHIKGWGGHETIILRMCKGKNLSEKMS